MVIRFITIFIDSAILAEKVCDSGSSGGLSVYSLSSLLFSVSGSLVSLFGVLGLIGMLPEKACGAGAGSDFQFFIFPGTGSGAALS